MISSRSKPISSEASIALLSRKIIAPACFITFKVILASAIARCCSSPCPKKRPSEAIFRSPARFPKCLFNSKSVSMTPAGLGARSPAASKCFVSCGISNRSILCPSHVRPSSKSKICGATDRKLGARATIAGVMWLQATDRFVIAARSVGRTSVENDNRGSSTSELPSTTTPPNSRSL